MFLPVNQVRLTNVAVVRMQRHGKRFEVACYRNKIINYRQGIETDLSEVLQTVRVFTNVSKGQFASSKDLQTAFETTDQETVCKIILDQGQIQVSDLERSATLENTAREVANLVASKCVHPVSNRQYTVSQIRDAMKKAEFSVQPVSSRTVKQQFLDCVKSIQEKGVLEIQRAKMELAIVIHDNEKAQTLIEELKEDASALLQNDQKINSINRVLFLIDPSFYRTVENITKKYNVTLEIVRQIVREETDVEVTLEVERKSTKDQEVPLSLYPENTIGIEKEMASVNISYQDADDHENSVHPYHSNDEEDLVILSSRKQNKNAAKKSKKAKRREKEDENVRQQRMEAEKLRREEREKHLGNVQRAEEFSSSTGVTHLDTSMKSCNTCGGSFTTAGYRSHFKSDWHRYNQQLKIKGVPPVEEKEFNMISELL